jgi:diguanylate cyclase (GGDEF)-like protein/PAS domain S-box-containing protein
MRNRYEYIVNTSKDFITLINRDYVYEVVNESYSRVVERSRDELIGVKVSEIWGEETFKLTLKGYLDRCFRGEEIHYIEKFRFGLEQRYMHVSYYPYRDGRTITHVLVFSHDITKLGKIESKLINYEYRDPLTGLFNRRSLDIILEMELEKARRSRSDTLRGVCFISIENLSEISQVHGQTIGDILLENSGLRIKSTLRNSDFIFRYEGNELVVVLTNMARNTDAAKVAGKIHEVITTPYENQGYTINLTCFIGVSVFPDDGETKEEIVKNAITALREAQKQESPFLLFNEQMNRRALEKLQMEKDLHRAFTKQQFELYYQPIVDVSGKIAGCEALIRWHHDEKGLVPPGSFIPLAEESGLIDEIGTWAIFNATKQISKWVDQYDLYVSINLSAREFENEELPEILQHALKQADSLHSRFIRLEITETEEMKNPEKAISRMKNLTDLGIQIYIDDFGTGLSSLSYLKKLPATTLKIDKVFIDEILESEDEVTFVDRIVSMAKSRGKTVIIEGVSKKEQFELLKEMECDFFQGFYFSKPVPATVFEEYLEAGGRLP